MALARVSLVDRMPEAVPQQPPAKAPRVWMAATAAMTVLGASHSGDGSSPRPEPHPLIHFITATPQGIATNPIAVSRDGSHSPSLELQ